MRPSDTPAPTVEEYLKEYVPEFEWERLRAHRDAHENEGAIFDFQYSIIRANGETGYGYVRVQSELIRDANGELIKRFGTALDITENVLAQKELSKYRDFLEESVRERTQELETAHNELIRRERLGTLGQLTATVSQELRNPLGTLSSSLHAIAIKAEIGGVESGATMARAQRSMSRCDNIIEELLDYTRVHDLELVSTDVDKWCAEVLDDFSVPNEIIVTRELRSGTTIAMEPERMRRCLTNILNNACQAMSDNTVSLLEKRLDIRTNIDNTRVEIQISDTGSGFDEDIHKKVFEPLYSSKIYGVGLGLPIVKQIMQQHRGGIENSSSIGIGTCVKLWLPINQVT